MRQCSTIPAKPGNVITSAAGFLRCMRRAFARRLPFGLLLATMGYLSSLPAGAQILERKLLAPDTGMGDRFGETVAMVPGWAFCAAPQDDDVQSQSGAVYAYRGTDADWVFAQKLKASDPFFGASMGYATAASGEWMVATTPFDRFIGGYDTPGSAHVYRFQAGSWVHSQKIIASDYMTIYQKYFGQSAALRGNRMAIGEWNDHTVAYQAGSAYVFELQGGTWVEVAKVYASDFEVSGAFGYDVAIDGDRLVVGAPEHDNGGPYNNPGAVYVFERQANGTWVQTQKLVANDPANQSQIGFAVAIEGDTILVGAPSHNHVPQLSGAVYVFERQGSSFVQTQELSTFDNGSQDQIGGSVAIGGDIALISAEGDQDLGIGAGSAYAFRRINGAWQQIGKLLPPDGHASQLFGSAVAISGRNHLVGASFDDDACPTNVGCNSGSAYVFELAPDAIQFCSCPTQGPCANHDDFGGCNNSRNMGGILSAAGTSSVLEGDLEIQAAWLPLNVPGIMLMSTGSSTAPLADGQLCIGGSSIFRFKPGQSTGPSGVFKIGPGIAKSSLNGLSQAGWITPGSTWNFQAWFRDNQGPCGGGSNLTSAVSVEFRP